MIRALTYSTGYTLKTVVRDFSTGVERAWNTSTPAFEAFNPSNIANYGIATTEGSTGTYTWTVPALPASANGFQYQSTTYQLAAGEMTLATTDLVNPVWLSSFQWNGAMEVENVNVMTWLGATATLANGYPAVSVSYYGGFAAQTDGNRLPLIGTVNSPVLTSNPAIQRDVQVTP